MVQEIRAKDGKIREFGAIGTLTHAYPQVVATGSGSTILAYSADNTYIMVVNNSAATVTITLEGTTPTTTIGIPLRPSGGYYEMGAAYGNLPTGAIKGISSSGTVNVFVTSGTGV